MFKKVCWSSCKLYVTVFISEINFTFLAGFSKNIATANFMDIKLLPNSEGRVEKRRDFKIFYRNVANALAINKYSYCRGLKLAFLALLA